MSGVPYNPLTKTPYGRYRLLWATDLIGETQRRGWVNMPITVNTEHLRGHRETLEMEHEFARPDREDTVDLALALMVTKGLAVEEERPLRKLLCMAYDESDRFGS